MNIKNIEIKKIREHEAIDGEHVKELKLKIMKSGFFKEPIIIDKKSFVVLDGHHRLNSCKQLGFKKIPCLIVDYFTDKHISVTSRRKEIAINKHIVVAMGLSNQVFPHKTTKHSIHGRVKNSKISVSELIC